MLDRNILIIYRIFMIPKILSGTMKKINIIATTFLLLFLSSCGPEWLNTDARHVYFRIVNNSSDAIVESFFTRSANSEKYKAYALGTDPILPSDSVAGSLSYHGTRDNSWPSFFEYWKFDTLYVVCSGEKLAGKDGQLFNSLPNDSKVYRIHKCVKEDFVNMNPDTDVVTFIYP